MNKLVESIVREICLRKELPYTRDASLEANIELRIKGYVNDKLGIVRTDDFAKSNHLLFQASASH